MCGFQVEDCRVCLSLNDRGVNVPWVKGMYAKACFHVCSLRIRVLIVVVVVVHMVNLCCQRSKNDVPGKK